VKKNHFLLLIFILSIFQTAFLDRFNLFGVKPDIMLVAVVIAGLCFELRWAFFYALIAGLLKDTFSSSPHILYTILFIFLAFFISKIRRKISIDNNFMRLVLIFIVSFLCSVVIGILFSLWARFIPIGIFLRTAFLDSIFTVSVSCLAFKFLKPEFYL